MKKRRILKEFPKKMILMYQIKPKERKINGSE